MRRTVLGWGGWATGAALLAALALGLDGYAADLYRKLLLTAKGQEEVREAEAD